MKLSCFRKQFETVLNFVSPVPESLVKKCDKKVKSKIKFGKLNYIFSLKRSHLQDHINTYTIKIGTN